jgi:hypothetical protein
MWCKPESVCPYPASGTYLTDIDDPGTPGSYMFDPSSQSNKWLGFFFGYGLASFWPAAREGANAPIMRSVAVSFDLTSVSGAAQARIIVTAPSGAASTTICTASPCVIQVDARQGNHQIRIDYLSALGVLIERGSDSVLPVSYP